MLQRSARDHFHSGERRLAALMLFSLLFAVADVRTGTAQAASTREADSEPIGRQHYLTNAMSFRALSGKDYLNECAFHLEGVITFIDTNRNLVVVQDDTGAVALNFSFRGVKFEVGQFAVFDGTNIYPYVVSFPDYPFRPSATDIRTSFEAPMGQGDYYVTRMRGYLRPAVSGEYTFWVASDNSSELWLSTSEDPAKSRRVAFIPRYGWVNSHEWSRMFSQRSETFYLEGGRSYYVEAFQEQTTLADHLSVAWQGPGFTRSVIPGKYLSPWTNGRTGAGKTQGILREYWTNYSAGNLAPLTTPTSFESALTVDKVRVTILGRRELPRAAPIALTQRVLPQDNFRWVEVEGRVKFIGVNDDVAYLELSDGQGEIEVRALHWTPELAHSMRNLPVRVQGVSEAMNDSNGVLVPGVIWASSENSISLVDPEETTNPMRMGTHATTAAVSPNPAMSGFYGTHGVVTFNDRVFGKDYLFIQEDAACVFVSLKDRGYQNDLKVGQWIDLGGHLQPGKYVPVINPMVMTEVGWRSLPTPMAQPVQFPIPENCDGRWTEIEGVVHSINTNGTLSMAGKGGPICVWVGQTPLSHLLRYVDAKLRVRGVLSLTILDVPILLIPSRSHIDVEEEAPPDPFVSPMASIAEVIPDGLDVSSLHRVRLTGGIIYHNKEYFFLQDRSGGIRVQLSDGHSLKVGETVEVIGFPTLSGRMRILTEAIIRSAEPSHPIVPKQLDLEEALSFKQSDTLVQVDANVLSQKTIGDLQVLELQEQQRVFQATLADSAHSLPLLPPGSQIRVTGVCDNEPGTQASNGKTGVEKLSFASLNIWLRSPADVLVLKGPPWWTLKRTVLLVGALFMVLAVALLWVHLLGRRLQRQRRAQLAFSQLLLEKLESERRRIAANLHDGLGQILIAIKNQAVVARQRAADESGVTQRLDEISGATSQAIEEVRQITHGLRPYQLDRLGLTQAIRAIVDRTSGNEAILFACRVEDIDSLFDEDSEIHVYRIVQEAVNNVVKHSAATEAAVVVKKRSSLISISIRDNGRGFDTGVLYSSQPHDLGYGLSGIAERVRILDGSWTIDSHPGEGTSLTVEVPLPVHKNGTGNNDTGR